ncbi:MAG: type II toxin-antitoxin system HicA family toxin [Planctomycetota bacterium]
MASMQKLLDKVLSARSDANIKFSELRKRLSALGFDERIKGDHHIQTRDDVEEILNLQPLKGGKAKPYQVKQCRNVITKYRLGLDDEA